MITLGRHKSDNNNRMIKLTVFCAMFIYNWANNIWLQKATDSIIRDSIKQRELYIYYLVFLPVNVAALGLFWICPKLNLIFFKFSGPDNPTLYKNRVKSLDQYVSCLKLDKKIKTKTTSQVEQTWTQSYKRNRKQRCATSFFSQITTVISFLWV
jgi:hypothetical protein